MNETAEREELLALLKKIKPRPDNPMGISMDGHGYSMLSMANYAVISMDEGEPCEFFKREFMTSDEICADTEYYLNQGSLENAQACVEQGLALEAGLPEDHQNWRVYYLAGLVALRQRLLLPAVNLLDKAIASGCPDKIGCLNDMGAALSILGEAHAALNCYEGALEEDPDHLETLHNLGGYWWDVGNLKKAAECYMRALTTDPGYLPSYEEVADLFKACNNPEMSEAFRAFFRGEGRPDNLFLVEAASWLDNYFAQH